MSDERIRDVAQLYLTRLQLGYRVEEFSFTDFDVGTLLAPSNANRVLIYFSHPSTAFGFIGFRTPGGLIIPWTSQGMTLGTIATVQHDLMVPTFEWVGTQFFNGVIQGVGIVKK